MKQNICELDTMIFFREALEAHEDVYKRQVYTLEDYDKGEHL